MKFLLLLTFLSTSLLANDNISKLKAIKTLSKFAFGSCNKEYKPQPMWKYIIKDEPQLFLWGGDNIYGDKGPNKDDLLLKYLIQNRKKGYVKLKKSAPIIGIWDDHDYGTNNGNSDYIKKYISQQLFQDFMMIPKGSTRRAQEGIYTSYTFGEAGKQVKFLLLDNRFHLTDKNSKLPSVLGPAQWLWLKNELRNSQAQVHFIVSGIPFLPEKMIHTEEWADYPREKERLLNLLKQYKTKGVFFLSGDKHFSAITYNHGYPEFMSSGLTHETSAALIPWLRTKFPKSFFKINYGLVTIDWNARPIILKIQIKNEDGTALEQRYKLYNNRFVKSAF